MGKDFMLGPQLQHSDTILGQTLADTSKWESTIVSAVIKPAENSELSTL